MCDSSCGLSIVLGCGWHDQCHRKCIWAIEFIVKSKLKETNIAVDPRLMVGALSPHGYTSTRQVRASDLVPGRPG